MIEQRCGAIGPIGALVEETAALPNVSELFYAFAHDPYGRVPFPTDGLPPTLLAASTLPALVSLERVAERAATRQHTLDTMPVLEELVATNDRDDLVRTLRHARARPIAWNLTKSIHDLVEPATTLGFRIEHHTTEHRVSMRRAGELVQRRWGSFAPQAGGVTFTVAVPRGAAEHRRVRTTPSRPSPRRPKHSRSNDDPPLRELAATLARSRDARILVRRYEG